MTILNIETVNRFRTADGQEFENKIEAQRHATVIEVTERATQFVTNGLGYTKSHLTGAVKAIVEWELHSRFGSDENKDLSDGEEQKQAA